MSVPHPPRVLAASALAPVRERLAELGFDEAGCARRLGLGSMRNAVPRMAVRQAQGAKDRFPREPQEPLDLLIALLLFVEPQPLTPVRAALGAPAWDALLAAGLLRQEGSDAAANVILFPCAGLLLATDNLDDDGVTNRVMPLFSESYDLAALAVRAPVEAALDLCTGSGIHALLASRHAGRAVGVDVSPRALAFADLNARLNGIENAEFVRGDLYAPVEGSRFGLITANPPYNPELASRAGDDYHSGGESGEEILSAIVRRLPEFLAPGGHGQIVSLFVHRQGDPLLERIGSWLGPARDALDVLVTHRPVDYRTQVLKGESLSPEEQALHESWKRQGIASFSFGMIHLRFTPAGRRPFLVEGSFGEGLRGPGLLAVAEKMEALSLGTAQRNHEGTETQRD